MIVKIRNIFMMILIGTALMPAQTSWQSQRVFFGDNGKLVYTTDSENNRIPDFSYAGYKNSDAPVPSVNIVKTISALAGDNTANIQNAINEVGLMPLQNGIRGAILLSAGRYEVSGKIKLNYSGIVLRGAGEGSDPAVNTIIVATGDSATQTTVVTAGGGSARLWRDSVSSTKTDIISDSVLTGTYSFEVANASKYRAGDNIIIYQPSTDAWLKSVNYGGTHGGPAWSSNPDADAYFPAIVYNRWIKSINGNKITIDVPVFNHLIRKLSQSYIYKYSRTGLLTNIGIENLRIDIRTNGNPYDEHNHAWEAIDLYQIEDSWVKNCTMLHFGHSGIRCNTATRITIENCNALDPVSKIEGERRYNFNMYTASQQILVKNCHASNGRHHYVSNGTSLTSGIVFTNCTSSGAYTSSEGHRWWSQGILYDNHKETDNINIPGSGTGSRLLGLYNRGNYGTSHGWTTANCVAWNCDAGTKGTIIIQKPPTAQNYAIGCSGRKITGLLPDAPFEETEGFIEGNNKPGLIPASLYQAQLNERKGITSVREKAGDNSVETGFHLEQNFPNPFNPDTKISYSIYSPGIVRIKLYDSLGREIMTPHNGYKIAGSYTINVSMSNYSSGIYIYELSYNGLVLRKKMELIK